MRLSLVLLILSLSGAGSPVALSQTKGDYASRVDPFIGTGGHGHTYPGALRPFGMMQLSPDTRLEGWDGCSGYHFDDSLIYGFSHTHLSGTGCSDYGDLLITPSNTPVRTMPFRFSHRKEKAEPGYYSVQLPDPGIRAELTTTARCGMHRYAFTGPQRVVHIDLKHRDEVLDSRLEIVDSVTLRGYRFSRAWAGNQKFFFEIRFSQPFRSPEQPSGAWTGKAVREYFTFRDNGKPLLIKVGMSGVDEAGAHRNLEAEMPGWDFDSYRWAARTAWNKELGKLDAQGGTQAQQTIFYTALYHCMSAPNLYSDVDNRYRGRDDRIHSTEGKFDYYTVFSLWDTHRAEHPLLTLIDRKRTNDFITTFIRQYEEGGRLPVWELSSNETECMIGYHAVPVIWDAYSHGVRGFDAEKAYAAMKHSAMLDHFGLASYKKYGLVRSDDEHESVSKTLEYAYDDWCIAQMAKALNKTADHDYFLQRSQSWKNVFDPTTGFMRPRLNGMLFAPFSPYTVDNNFTEANSWQYSFFVPQDIPGLMAAHGGKAAFERRLDGLFAAKTATEGREQADITGLIGQYAHGNEPSHHIAYLYNYAGNPGKTRAIVKQVMDSFYRVAPDGLIGNEDCGQMSAWYVWSAMGLYPVCPGSGNTFERGYALFDRVRVSDDKGHTFTLTQNGTDKVPFTYASHRADVPAADVVVPAPFIAEGQKVFRGVQQIRMADMDPGAAIWYAEGDGAFRKYASPVVVKNNTEIRFYAQRGESRSPVQTARFYRLPDDRRVRLTSTYNKQYTAGGAEGLIDGLHGGTNWRSGGWQGYQGQDFDGTVEFQRSRPVRKITATFLEDQNAWIFYPRAVSFYGSDDGVHWRLIETVQTRRSDHDMKVTTAGFSTTRPVRAKYVRVAAKSFGAMPDWHEGRGEPTFIFVDEIEVR